MVALGKSRASTGTLTGSTAQTNPPQDVRLKPFAVPDCQLSAGLSQVAGLEAVVHHGVVVGGADGALHHPRLLTTLSTGIWEYVACRVKMMS